MAPSTLILMADYGNDPTEVAVPYQAFVDANLSVQFATETGAVPTCDEKMTSGWTGSLLGASKSAVATHKSMVESSSYKQPLSWSFDSFDILAFDLVLLPGGHDKGMRQYIESKSLHKHLAKYVADMRNPGSKKSLIAICHGVQVLAAADEEAGGRSIIHDFETTALPAPFEQGIFWATRLFLGDYYKTFGVGTPSVEEVVKKRLDNPKMQWKTSLANKPFTHRDPKFSYISARFPPDAQELAEQAVAMTKALVEQT